MKKRISKSAVFLLLPIFIICYLICCSLLYFFEPVSYNAPDLSLSDFSFDLYNKFDYNKNDQFYIKQISYNDIVSAPDDIRLKYVDNTIVVISEDNISFNEMTTLANNIDGTICGYIDIIDFYQISFDNKSYNELTNICSVLNNDNRIEIAIPDYFEETPVSETSTETEISKNYYYDIIDAYAAFSLNNNITSEITVGIIDTPVYSDHKDINVINKDDYSNDLLKNTNIITSPSHGTHVAGIIAANKNSKTQGIAGGAKIYSENGINNSVSYWLAAITNMIVNQNIKVINISMGYNSYIPISASLGCEFAQNFIRNENELFESALKNLINSEYEFLICVAAGNENGKSLYKTNSGLFSYGNKKLLGKIDIFGMFASKPDYCDASYQFLMTDIDDTDVRDRIMIVGCCDSTQKYSRFASKGNSVDIVAPGEIILSTGYYTESEFMSGTSMSAPFVSATASLLFASDNNIRGNDVKNILIETSSKNIADNDFNYPLLNIKNALEYVNN